MSWSTGIGESRENPTTPIIPASSTVYVAMDNWLESFAYRIEIGPAVFAGALLTEMMIAWLSVNYQALRAARVDPVRSLKCD